MKIFIARTHRKRLGAVVKSGGQSLTGSSSFTTIVYVSTTMIYDRDNNVIYYYFAYQDLQNDFDRRH